MSDLRIGEAADEDSHFEPHSRHGCLPALVALAVIVAIGVFVYVQGVSFIKDLFSDPEDYSGNGTGSVVVEVEAGDTSTDIADTLYKANVVASEDAFIDAAKENAQSRDIQVGYYTLHKKMSAENALTLLLNPKSLVSDTVTIPEGERADEIVEIIASGTDFSRKQLEKALSDTRALDLPAYAEGDVEGYLFPATYAVTPDSTPTSLLKEMVDQFKQRADSVGLIPRAKELGVSPHDVVIVASLVQAEASRTQDMPKVASVIYNRDNENPPMPLQLDSTLHYAVDSRGEVATSDELRSLDSPYNSYEIAGLPPTAIDSPGEDALSAALQPANTDYLYFVTVNLRTGETKFARTYTEHLRNRNEYLQYCTTSDAC